MANDVQALGAEAAFLDRALAGVIAELEAEEMVGAIIKSRNGKLTDRDAVLTIVRIEALRNVRDRVRSRVSAGERMKGR